MNLNRGRALTSIPGPSVIPEDVLRSMHRSFPNMYEGPLVDISHSVFDDLPKVAHTEGKVFMAISNGHGAWEMSLTNTMRRGDKVLVLASGRFAIGWGEQAEQLGCEVETIDFGDRGPVDPDRVEERLRADTAHEIKAILVVQIDTASGVWNDIGAIRKAIDAAGHPALYMVDCVASLASVPYFMDAWGVDITIGGSQKGLMVPPGLGLVWASEKALKAHETAGMVTPDWNWAPRLMDGAHYLKFCGTPPIQHIYAMRTALDMLFDEGLENVWARHTVFADAVRAAVEAWAAPGGFELNITDLAHRSDATTTILGGSIDCKEMRRICETDAGLVLGGGLGSFEDKAFRIGHMGHLNPPMVLGTLGTIEATLAHMGASMGGAGIAAASRVIAEALGRKAEFRAAAE
ncbi:MAG: pyridoxal-phosphate-dependent aminotransferase family protein [Paracoccaceae bacterium]